MKNPSEFWSLLCYTRSSMITGMLSSAGATCALFGLINHLADGPFSGVWVASSILVGSSLILGFTSERKWKQAKQFEIDEIIKRQDSGH